MSQQKFTNSMAKHQKNWFGKWHTWAGIFAGSILIVVSLTGSLLVFEQELDAWLNPELFDFEEQEHRLSYQEIYDSVQQAHPAWEINSIFEMPQRNNCYSVGFIKEGKFEQAIVNPHTGIVAGTRVYSETTMGIIRALHRTLLIPTAGKYIVGIASLIMVVLMITGLRLWIPKKWSKVKERLTVKKGTGFKRQNYDLHNSLGFYFSPFVTLISLTGAAITFSPLVILTLFLVSFEPPKSLDEILGAPSTYQADLPRLSIKEIQAFAEKEEPNAVLMGLSIPRDSIGTFAANMVTPGRAKTGDFTIVNIDQYSGEILMNVNDLPNLGKAYANWVTPIHYGTFGGLPTRILALITTLIVPFLFISGFIIWWARWKKMRRAAKATKRIHNVKKESTIREEFVLQSNSTKP